MKTKKARTPAEELLLAQLAESYKSIAQLRASYQQAQTAHLKLRRETEEAGLLDERIEQVRWQMAETDADANHDWSFREDIHEQYAKREEYTDEDIVADAVEDIGFDGLLQELGYVTTQNKDGKNVLYKQIANDFCLHVIGKHGNHLPVTRDEATFQLYSTSGCAPLKIWDVPIVGNSLLSAIDQIEKEAYEAIK